MRRYRPLTVCCLSIVVSALVGGVFGRSALAARRQDPGALQDVRRGAQRDRDELRRQGRVRPARLQRHPRHARHARPAFELLRSARNTRRCASARKAATTASASRSQPIDGDITAQSVFEGSPAYKKGVRRGDVIARIAGEDAKGWTTEQAMHKLRGPKGTTVQHRDQAPRLRAADSARSHARRGPHPRPSPPYFMVDATTGYIQHAGFRREHRPRGQARAARSHAKGMKRLLFDIRGNPGGPLDQAIKVANEFLPKGKMIVYTRGRDRELRSGLPRDRGRRVPRHSRRHDREPQQRERVGNRHRRAAGSRPRVHRRRDDVRQGAGAVGLPHQRRRRAGADDRALLHAERPPDSAAVGRDRSTST